MPRYMLFRYGPDSMTSLAPDVAGPNVVQLLFHYGAEDVGKMRAFETCDKARMGTFDAILIVDHDTAMPEGLRFSDLFENMRKA
jgi:hypothetical protein